MAFINAYLTFNGNCREAMLFYQQCLGGELSVQTVGESPMAEKMPAWMKKNVLHSTLSSGGLVIMASDMVEEGGLFKGNAVSLMLNCGSELEVLAYYARLSQGGTPRHRPEDNYWGAMFGDLTDKFGNHWLLHYSQEL